MLAAKLGSLTRSGAPRSSSLAAPLTPVSPVSGPNRGPERVGPYQLSFEIASGGMATVHLARVDLPGGIHRFVALKRIHPHLMKDPTFVEMFVDEARIASQLNHANVCNVLDFGFANGAYYMAMEYLVGETLSTLRRTLLRRRPGPEPQRWATLVARMIADAAEGVHAAHELRDTSGVLVGVVHRDVTPDNVFLTHDGVIKLVDFGVARASRQKHKTRTGVLKGKYAYIQPEVVHGGKADRRADVWGLGVILWELLTLKRLFHRRTDLDTLRAVLDEPIPAPSELRQDLPVELDAIVARALARDPTQRYQTARELGRALTRFLADQRAAVGLPELAELMDEVFPGGRGRKAHMLEIAESVEASPETDEEPPPSSEQTLSSLRTRVRPRPSRFARFGVRPMLKVALLTATVAGGFWALRSWPVSGYAKSPSKMERGAVVGAPITAPPASSAAESREPVPIRLGTGPYVLQIEPGSGSSAEGVVLRIRADGEPTR